MPNEEVRPNSFDGFVIVGAAALLALWIWVPIINWGLGKLGVQL